MKLTLSRLRITNQTLLRLCLFSLLWSVFMPLSLFAQQAELDQFDAVEVSSQNQNSSELASDIEALQRALIDLNRDLTVLEEDLLFPSSSQMAIYLSMDVDKFFALDSIEIKIDQKTISHYLYTERQVSALMRGGVHRVYLGNINQGEHKITALFSGLGPENNPYERTVTLPFNKTDEAVAIELQIIDSTRSQQPEFVAISL